MITNKIGPYVNKISAFFMMLERKKYQSKTAPLT